MKQINRTPSMVALVWGVALLAALPATSMLMRPEGVNVTWTALMVAEGLLILLCAWAQLASSPDAWTRLFAIIACVMAVFVGIDLNEARDAQVAYDRSGEYDIQLVASESRSPRATSHHGQSKIDH